MTAQPAAGYVDFGHWLIDEGVDLVHGHSAHNFQAIERYNDGVILYDCGDFVDDYAVDRELRNDRGFLFEVVTGGDGTVRGVRLRPTEIADCRVQPAEERVAAWSRERMRERSRPFGTADAFVTDGDGLWVPVADQA